MAGGARLVFTNRLFVGLYSVLAALRSTAGWRAIFDEDLTGVPTTELGRLDADFFGAKAVRDRGRRRRPRSRRG